MGSQNQNGDSMTDTVTPPIVTSDPPRYIKRGDLVVTNDAIYLDRDAPGQPDRMTFANPEADADGYVTAQHDPT